jgi:hypothetical protein
LSPEHQTQQKKKKLMILNWESVLDERFQLGESDDTKINQFQRAFVRK